jgi:hypothetical protein
MKTIFGLLLLFTLASCFLFRKAPVIRTYSISGTITFVNDCTGNGADNPISIQLITVLTYKDGSTSNFITQVPMVAVGVTSTGTYTISDVPTNVKGSTWKIDFPDSCSFILCDTPPTICTNGSTNTRQPININNTAMTYDYRYGCSCI